MLFQLVADTPRCVIFTSLNDELCYFLEKAIKARRFVRGLFSDGVGQVVWDNAATRKKFKSVWDVLRPLSLDQRQRVHDDVLSCQSVSVYFLDKTTLFPEFEKTLFDSIKGLTKYLFENTKDLAGIRDACNGETIASHFDDFRRKNSNVCPVCGTENLAQKRANVAPEDQWRSPYDHLLDKKHYPVFGIHPQNLVPICHTCNSKAKGSKALLLKKQKGHADVRRVSFYPYDECARGNVSLALVDDGVLPVLAVSLKSGDACTQEKIDAWDDVYQIKSRVEGELGDVAVWIVNDCRPRDCDDFKDQINRRLEDEEELLRGEPWVYWRSKLYRWVSDQGDEMIQTLWDMIQSRKDDEAYRKEYGI